ncbi:hypothetical protein [Cupriavidus sp. AcVe19-6a]|uniref:hypothetical protein n=1 Tax=Cupriavidus sp. AcVe19-6a TaxID=2821358 RepID=UPI001AE955EB|nr:hypothetical protein [Cupriavidus sp. AcVe19-6a]MBP0636938.1 hypothetical protein [Cupriavidus sp. AcVe19-6a]
MRFEREEIGRPAQRPEQVGLDAVDDEGAGINADAAAGQAQGFGTVAEVEASSRMESDWYRGINRGYGKDHAAAQPKQDACRITV